MMEIFLILILLLALAPAVVVIRHTLRQTRKKQSWLRLMQANDRMVYRHKLFLDHAETMGNRLIALDKRQMKLIFLDHQQNPPVEECINLSEIVQLSLKEERRRGELRKVLLEVERYGGLRLNLVFFDDDTDHLTQLPGRRRQATHWLNRIEIYKPLRTASAVV